MHFLIKAAAPLIAGGGLGTGGVYVYRSVIPTTWREYLEREGFRILSTEGDNKEFKAIFSEHKSLITGSEDSILKDATTIDDYDKIREYCLSELQKNTDGNANTQDQLIKLCTYSGITTAKSKVVQKKKDSDSTKWSWIKEEKHWKAVFAVNKYNPKFLEWLNEGKSSKKITNSDKPSEKHSELKKKCEEEWNKKYSDNKDNKDLYNHIYWWCSKPQQTTVEERIKARDTNWQKEESNWSKIKTTWENTKDVEKIIKSDLSKTGETDTLEDNDYQLWCSDQLKKNLGEDNLYRDKYVKIKSVCKKTQK